jgi:GNAT superfamily N-acetyltransferase
VTEVIVRRAVLDDAEDLGRVHVVSWRAAYAGLVPDSLLAGLSVETAVGRWSERLSSEPSGRRIIVAEVGGIVVGFAVVVAGRDGAAPETGQLAAIYAEPRVWSQGVGHALHEVALQQLRDLGVSSATLWVLNTNERARRFYERHGWELGGPDKPVVKTVVKDGVPLPATQYRRGLS